MLVRPGNWLLALIVAIAVTYVAGWLGGRYLDDNSGQPDANLVLRNQIADLRTKLAEAETILKLRENEMQGVKTELAEKRKGIQALQEQVDLYENVMEAGNKAFGVRILRADIEWSDKQTMNYDILLVRGGTYRWGAKGHIEATASDDAGHSLLLQLGKDGEKLPYRLDTHIFLRGSIPWPHDWRPQRLVIDCLDSHGKAIDTKEIILNGDNT